MFGCVNRYDTYFLTRNVVALISTPKMKSAVSGQSLVTLVWRKTLDGKTVEKKRNQTGID